MFLCPRGPYFHLMGTQQGKAQDYPSQGLKCDSSELSAPLHPLAQSTAPLQDRWLGPGGSCIAFCRCWPLLAGADTHGYTTLHLSPPAS